MDRVHISAGGKGTRMAEYIAEVSPDLPKHLLPIPTVGQTLLGEIVHRAEEHFSNVMVWTSEEGYFPALGVLDHRPKANVVVDNLMTGPLGPLVREVRTSGKRAYGCAGDFYCDFSWADFERFHEDRGLPVSILVAKSVPTPLGARFKVKNGQVTGWSRVQHTTADDLINIGCYIVDPWPEVVDLLEGLSYHKEDPFNDLFVPRGLMAGYNPGTRGYNINVPEVYKSLLQALNEKQ